MPSEALAKEGWLSGLWRWFRKPVGRKILTGSNPVPSVFARRSLGEDEIRQLLRASADAVRHF